MVLSNTNILSGYTIRRKFNRRSKATGILNNYVITRGEGLTPKQRHMNSHILPDQENLTYFIDVLFNETQN